MPTKPTARTASAVVAGLLLTQAACGTSAGEPVASSSASTAPAVVGSSAAAPTDNPSGVPLSEIFSGRRQVLIHLAEGNRDMSATYEGPIALGDGTDDGARFRIIPAETGGDQYLIQAMRLREEGGKWCVNVRRDGTAPTDKATLHTTECAENEDTLWGIGETGKTDDQGRPTYAIVSDKWGAIQYKADTGELYVEEVGDAPISASWSFVDRGEPGQID